MKEHADRHGDALELEKQAREQHRAAMEGRIDEILNEAAGRHGAITDHHATIGEELEAIKEALAKETGTRESDVYELRELVGGETLARQDHHSSVKELIAAEKKEREKMNKAFADDREARDGRHIDLEQRLAEHHGSMQELMAAERKTRETAHGRLQDNHMNEKAARETHHASMSERIDYLEKLLNDSADKYARDMEAGHNKLRDEMKGHITIEKAAR